MPKVIPALSLTAALLCFCSCQQPQVSSPAAPASPDEPSSRAYTAIVTNGQVFLVHLGMDRRLAHSSSKLTGITRSIPGLREFIQLQKHLALGITAGVGFTCVLSQ